MSNPFTKVHAAIWELLESDNAFNDAVKVGNRIKFTDDNERTNKLKQAVVTADMPELAVVITGIDAALFNTSSSSKFILTFSLIINTGDFQLDRIALDVNWILYCNLAKWKGTLSAVEWCNERFVKRVDFISNAIGQTVAERNRGINGFSSVAQIVVECHLKTSNLNYTEI